MVILITGASHTGKTLLAQHLLEKLHYPCFSIDHLKMGLIRSGNTVLTPEDDDALTDYLWPIVREMVKTAIENRQNLIVEGCYIPFGWSADFEEKYLRSIQFVCLAMTDEYIEIHFEEIKAHACDIEARLDDSSCTVDRLKSDNRAFAGGFKKRGQPVSWISDNFETATNEIAGRLAGKGEFVCQMCGACCRIPNGIVRVSDAEIARIATFLGVTEAEFIERETDVAPDRRGLILKSRPDGACAWLTDDNLCRINPVKPDKCRTFPNEWTNSDSHEVCPGLRTQL